MNAFLKKTLLWLFSLLVFVPLWGASTPLFWKASKDGQSIYLLGTIHIGSDDLYPLPEVIRTKLGSAQALYVELDIAKIDREKVQAQIDELAALPEGKTLFELLDSDTWFGLDKQLNEFQIQLLREDGKQPWYFIYLLSSIPSSRGEYDPELGIDVYIMDLARRKEVPVIPLETLERQLAVFANWPMEKQIAMLKELLSSESSSYDSIKALHDAWRDGDEAGLLAQEDAATADNEALKAFYKRLVDDRNATMLQTLLEKSSGQTDVFVAVGALHMIGDTGLVEALKKAGYQVEFVLTGREDAR